MAVNIIHLTMLTRRRVRAYSIHVMEAKSLIPDCEIEASESEEQDWTADRVRIELPPEAMARVHELLENPPQPTDYLRAAVKRYYK